MMKALKNILISWGWIKPKTKTLKIIYAVWEGGEGSGPQYVMAALWPVGADKPIYVTKLDGYKRLSGETKKEADAIIDKIAKGEDGINGEYVKHGFFEEVSLTDVPSDGRTDETKPDDGRDETIDRSTVEVMDRTVGNLDKGIVSTPIDLSSVPTGKAPTAFIDFSKIDADSFCKKFGFRKVVCNGGAFSLLRRNGSVRKDEPMAEIDGETGEIRFCYRIDWICSWDRNGLISFH